MIGQRSNGSGEFVAPEQVRLALAAVLSEREAQGRRDEVVVLRVPSAASSPSDASWIGEAISWLGSLGRRAVVRTARVLPRSVVVAAREGRASVVLQLASRDEGVQRALLGPKSDAASRLLLQAQHLRALDVPVSVLLAPLLPTLHTGGALEGLCRHVAAADLRDVSLALGRWSDVRQAALADVLPGSRVAAIARAFGVFDAGVPGGASVPLAHRDAVALHHQARRIAIAAGLQVDECGCAANCRAAGSPQQPFRSLLGTDLFAGVG